MYKRQVHDGLGGNNLQHGFLRILQQTDGLLRQPLAQRAVMRHHSAPVSYTHLDVYKRQIYLRRQPQPCHRNGTVERWKTDSASCIPHSCQPSQFAAIEALENCDEDVRVMAEEYDERRRLIVDSLNHMGLTCFEPEGAFYVFPSVKKTGLTSEEFCQQLLMSQRVAVVPGNAFGDCGEGFVRISYAASLENIIEALKRIELFLENI